VSPWAPPTPNGVHSHVTNVNRERPSVNLLLTISNEIIGSWNPNRRLEAGRSAPACRIKSNTLGLLNVKALALRLDHCHWQETSAGYGGTKFSFRLQPLDSLTLYQFLSARHTCAWSQCSSVAVVTRIRSRWHLDRIGTFTGRNPQHPDRLWSPHGPPSVEPTRPPSVEPTRPPFCRTHTVPLLWGPHGPPSVEPTRPPFCTAHTAPLLYSPHGHPSVRPTRPPFCTAHTAPLLWSPHGPPVYALLALYMRAKRSDYENNHTNTPSVWLQNDWSYTSTPPCAYWRGNESNTRHSIKRVLIYKHQAKKTYGGVKVCHPVLSISAVDGGAWWASRSCRFTSIESTRLIIRWVEDWADPERVRTNGQARNPLFCQELEG
jgi:hypothetical protein